MPSEFRRGGRGRERRRREKRSGARGERAREAGERGGREEGRRGRREESAGEDEGAPAARSVVRPGASRMCHNLSRCTVMGVASPPALYQQQRIVCLSWVGAMALANAASCAHNDARQHCALQCPRHAVRTPWPTGSPHGNPQAMHGSPHEDLALLCVYALCWLMRQTNPQA